jgi:hypothetical protein
MSVGNRRGVVVFAARGTTIGGAIAAASNLISGNRADGVFVCADGLEVFDPILFCQTPFTLAGANGTPDFRIHGNNIGTDFTGTQPVPNGADGIRISLLAFTHDIRGNRIAFNGANGISIPESNQFTVGLPAFSIQMLDNAIFSNTLLGIDLGDNGVTPNDPGDGDSGANQRQNFPVLTSTSTVASRFTTDGKLVAAASLAVNGTLNSTPNRTFTLQFYFGTTCASSSGQFLNSQPILLGSLANVTTGADGNANFMFPFNFPSGQSSGYFNSTATDSSANTSEFSACFAVTAPSSPSDFSLGFEESTVVGLIGAKGRITVLINRTGGFTGEVTVTPAPKFNGVKPKPPAPIITTESSVFFKYKIAEGIEPSTRMLTFTGTDASGRVRTATATLIVQ